jgi:hypothetical protein
MAIYPNKNKSHVGQFLNSDWTELPANTEYKASVEAAAAPPVVTSYPTTNPTKAGQHFIWEGNLWRYMTKAELDGLGWTSVSSGFPAPAIRVYNSSILWGNAKVELNAQWNTQSDGVSSNILYNPAGNLFYLDVLGYSRPDKIRTFSFYFGSGTTGWLNEIKNAELLLNLEDIGTAHAVKIRENSFEADALDAFFTALPATTKTATIDVADNPGSTTCDPSIATAKGYTVLI